MYIVTNTYCIECAHIETENQVCVCSGYVALRYEGFVIAKKNRRLVPIHIVLCMYIETGTELVFQRLRQETDDSHITLRMKRKGYLIFIFFTFTPAKNKSIFACENLFIVNHVYFYRLTLKYIFIQFTWISKNSKNISLHIKNKRIIFNQVFHNCLETL